MTHMQLFYACECVARDCSVKGDVHVDLSVKRTELNPKFFTIEWTIAFFSAHPNGERHVQVDVEGRPETALECFRGAMAKRFCLTSISQDEVEGIANTRGGISEG